METAGFFDVAIGVLLHDPLAEGGPRVLIARRPKAGVLGGYWEFPGGKREPGETLEACVVREFHEEVGLTVAVVEPLPVIEHVYDHGRVRLCPFICRWVAGEPRPIAVSEFRWVRPDELSAYRFPPANAELLRSLMARGSA